MSAFSCRICNSENLVEVLDLGRMPLANSLLSEDNSIEDEPRYPLDVVFCPSCTLVQITETVPPEILFSEYLYLSSFSETMLAHSAQSASAIISSRKLGSESLVIEAGSNDGYMLKVFQEAGISVLGVEPASNIQKIAQEQGIDTINEFFSFEVAKQLSASGKKADVFLANNVLAHVANLGGFVAGIREILKPAGVAVIEVPYLVEMISNVEFDTIYHEHLCYFSLHSLKSLFARYDMHVIDVEQVAIHGGSLRITVGSTTLPASPSVEQLIRNEKESGVDRDGYYLQFATRVAAIKDSLLTMLAKLKAEGKSIAAYGAAAKAAVLLNYCEIGIETIDFVVDRNPLKQDRLMPGVHIPVVSPKEFDKRQPDYLVILVWNLKNEIIRQQAEFANRGGKFIVAIPEPTVVS